MQVQKDRKISTQVQQEPINIRWSTFILQQNVRKLNSCTLSCKTLKCPCPHPNTPCANYRAWNTKVWNKIASGTMRNSGLQEKKSKGGDRLYMPRKLNAYRKYFLQFCTWIPQNGQYWNNIKLYILQEKMEKFYSVSKNKTWRELCL